MRLTVQFAATHPPEGWITENDGAAVPFTGWLGLVGVMEQVLDAARRMETTDALGSDDTSMGRQER